MSTVTVRRALPADVDDIARIWYRGWRDGHLGHVPDELVAIRGEETFGPRVALRVGTRAVEDTAIEDTAVGDTAVGDTVVATVDESVAGFVMVVGDEVEQVYVASDHRGTGLAGRLLAEAELLVAAGGHQRAWLAVATGNARARRFYERSGWTDDGPFDYPSPGPDGPIAVRCHRYVKPVGEP